MFQKEFAERLLANVNEDKYGRLAINTRLFCTVSRVCKVSPGNYFYLFRKFQSTPECGIDDCKDCSKA